MKLVWDPYRGVDWSTTSRFKGNFHSHTAYDPVVYPRGSSDVPPSYTIDVSLPLYEAHGFDVLALTEHDHRPANKADRGPNWPWPSEEGKSLFGVRGVECGYHEHVTSLWSDYHSNEGDTVHDTLRSIDELQGISWINHPGQYMPGSDWRDGDAWKRYIQYFRPGLYKRCLGMEVYNTGQQYPLDVELWDILATVFFAERPILGISNDDAHGPIRVGGNWMTVFATELTDEALREAMLAGRFTFSWKYTTSNYEQPPAVTSISTDGGSISIDAVGADEIRWVSCGFEVGKGPTLSLDTPGISRYVRAELRNQHGITHTQYWGFSRWVNPRWSSGAR